MCILNMHAISASCHALALHDYNIKRCFRSVKLIKLIRAYATRTQDIIIHVLAFDPDGPMLIILIMPQQWH